MALWFCNGIQYHDLMVFTQTSKFQIFFKNHSTLGYNKIPLIFATFDE
jgi:hypothetical protein